MRIRPGFNTEATLVKLVKNYLDVQMIFKNLTYRRINTGGVIRPRGMSKNPAVGMADFLIWFKNGPVLSLECKSATGVLSLVQRGFKNELTAMGHPYLMIRTLEELKEFVTLLGSYSSTTKG